MGLLSNKMYFKEGTFIILFETTPDVSIKSENAA